MSVGGRPTAPVVATAAGTLRGVHAGGVLAFLGIPYAAPPTDARRWCAPAPVDGWAGIRAADACGPIAPQAPSPFDGLLFPGPAQAQAEDCLTLNVWTPATTGRRPVMVWIHGGGFTLGAGSQPLYDGRRLAAAGDVVVVTVNYRLGALGFLRLDRVTGGRIPASGNEGLLDLVAALEWVRGNAAAFGGDADDVTVFGESAGAMAIGALLALPAARGLFRRAILQSGAAHTTASVELADRVAARFLELAGVRAQAPEALRALPAERLLEVQQALLAEAPRSGLGFLPFRPVIDGVLLSRRPIDAVRDGSAADVTLLAGVTADEWTLFGALNPQLQALDAAGLERRLAHLFDADEVAALLPLYRDHLAARGIEATPYELLVAILGDAWFGVPCTRLLAAQAAHPGGGYGYLFDWAARPRRLRACHAIELGFVFGWRERKFHGDGPAAERLEATVQTAWSRFAHTGVPGAGAHAAWPAWRHEEPALMRLGAATERLADPWGARAAFWERLDDERLGGG